MSYKVGLVISFIFVVLFFVFGMDMMSIQYIYSDLDSKATNIGYLIAKHGSLEEDFVKSIENHYQIYFECLSNCTPKFGDLLEYRISTSYKSFIISKDEMKLSVKRSTVIGYYD